MEELYNFVFNQLEKKIIDLLVEPEKVVTFKNPVPFEEPISDWFHYDRVCFSQSNEGVQVLVGVKGDECLCLQELTLNEANKVLEELKINLH